jgi:hypothetical protein
VPVRVASPIWAIFGVARALLAVANSRTLLPRRWLTRLRRGAPDASNVAAQDHHFDIEDAVADGDTVVVRGTVSGSHVGELWGIPLTGERVAAQQSHWIRVANGKVAEHWAVRDDLGTMCQLDLMPS